VGGWFRDAKVSGELKTFVPGTDRQGKGKIESAAKVRKVGLEGKSSRPVNWRAGILPPPECSVMWRGGKKSRAQEGTLSPLGRRGQRHRTQKN